MGILHIEDLKPDAFIDCVRSLTAHTITEKLDGTNITIGCDMTGKFYLSRSGKGNADRVYYPHQYDHNQSANHGYIFLLDLILSNEHVFKSRIRPGQAVVCELLMGRQPNAIVYGRNHLVFLHPEFDCDVSFTDAEWEAIQATNVDLRGHITNTIVDPHTHALQQNALTFSYLDIRGVPVVDSSVFALTASQEEIIAEYEKWLGNGTVGSTLTNRELLGINLSSVLKAERPGMKKARETATMRSAAFKHRIKEDFITTLSTLTPKFRSDDHVIKLMPSEDFGIEGVVATSEHETHVKIVNRRLFTAINAFNHTVRNRIRRTSYGSVPQDMEWSVSLKIKGISIVDNMLNQLYSLHGFDGFTAYTTIKPAMRKFKEDESIDNTIGTMAAAWGRHREKAIRNPIIVRGIIAKLLRSTLSILRNSRELYLTESAGYYLRLDHQGAWQGDNERVIGYTKAVHKRTMLMFAEVEAELNEMLDRIRFAESLDEIIYALFEKQLLSIH